VPFDEFFRRIPLTAHMAPQATVVKEGEKTPRTSSPSSFSTLVMQHLQSRRSCVSQRVLDRYLNKSYVRIKKQ
jgi:hypothetical protein